MIWWHLGLFDATNEKPEKQNVPKSMFQHGTASYDFDTEFETEKGDGCPKAGFFKKFSKTLVSDQFWSLKPVDYDAKKIFRKRKVERP